MNALFEAADEIQRFLRNGGERFCFIGGVALQREESKAAGIAQAHRDIDNLVAPVALAA